MFLFLIFTFDAEYIAELNVFTEKYFIRELTNEFLVWENTYIISFPLKQQPKPLQLSALSQKTLF